jgi:hypothetical protein
VCPKREPIQARTFLAARLAALLAAGLCWAGACLPAGALAAPSVSLHASLQPERLGHSTTVRLSVRVSPHGELVPPPVLGGELRYPAGMNVRLSGLGIDACSVATLELLGPPGCPPDSVMGFGSAVAALPIKREVVSEAARIAVVRTFERAGRPPALLLYIYDETALDARIVLPAQLLPASRPFGGALAIHVPLVPTFPEGPYVTVSRLSLVLGPSSLVYRERVHGRLVSYRPEGIPLPRHCPRGGFPFAVQLSFLGDGRAAASTAVPCPRRSR